MNIPNSFGDQPPWWVIVTFAAWVCVGIYFIVSMLAARRTVKREAGSKRAGDLLLIWGGYLCLFARFSQHGAWDTAYFEPLSRQALLGTIGCVIAVCGLAFTSWARAALGQYWSGVVALKADHKLVQSGPYRWVRHPLYTGLLAASAGTALSFGLWRCVLGAALLWTAFFARARREDALMAGQFGDEFVRYRTRTGQLWPRWG